MAQFFKSTDEVERKFYRVAENMIDLLNAQRGLTFGLAYEAEPLGDALWNLKAAPLTRSVKQNIFRQVFNTIFNNFLTAGNPEAYLSIFRQIFGETVDVQFTIINPGHVKIDIVTDSVDISDWQARELDENTFLFFDIVDDVDDEIVFQTLAGFETPREVEVLLFELTPYGIFTEFTLTIDA